MTLPSPMLIAAAKEICRRAEEIALHMGCTPDLALTIAIFERNQKDMEVIARAIRDLSKEAAALMASLQAKMGDGRG